MKEQISGLVE